MTALGGNLSGKPASRAGAHDSKGAEALAICAEGMHTRHRLETPFTLPSATPEAPSAPAVLTAAWGKIARPQNAEVMHTRPAQKIFPKNPFLNFEPLASDSGKLAGGHLEIC